MKGAKKRLWCRRKIHSVHILAGSSHELFPKSFAWAVLERVSESSGRCAGGTYELLPAARLAFNAGSIEGLYDPRSVRGERVIYSRNTN